MEEGRREGEEEEKKRKLNRRSWRIAFFPRSLPLTPLLLCPFSKRDQSLAYLLLLFQFFSYFFPSTWCPWPLLFSIPKGRKVRERKWERWGEREEALCVCLDIGLFSSSPPRPPFLPPVISSPHRFSPVSLPHTEQSLLASPPPSAIQCYTVEPT